MGSRAVHQFDASLSIGLDDVLSDERVALLALYDDTVVG